MLKGRVVILLVVAVLAGADSYSRTTSLPPLRMSYDDLKGLTAAMSAFVLISNSGTPSCVTRKHSVTISDGETEIEIEGEPFNSRSPAFPPSAYNVRLTYYCPDAPISQVEVFLSDDNSVTVRGTRPEQVDGLAALLNAKFARHLLSRVAPRSGRSFSSFSSF
jgi:hypothetical protein